MQTLPPCNGSQLHNILSRIYQDLLWIIDPQQSTTHLPHFNQTHSTKHNKKASCSFTPNTAGNFRGRKALIFGRVENESNDQFRMNTMSAIVHVRCDGYHHRTCQLALYTLYAMVTFVTYTTATSVRRRLQSHRGSCHTYIDGCQG